MKKQQKCGEAILEKATIVTYREGGDKKLGWALEFNNGIRLISKNDLVKVGATYKIKYTIETDGMITNISAMPITDKTS